MAWLLKWIGFLVTIAFRALLGAAGNQGGGGDPGGDVTLGGRGFHSETQWGSPISSSAEIGWRFTVGASDIDVAALMLYDADGGTETVNLWRVSDTTLIATASVTSAGGWGEEEITPVTLAAGADYVVTRYAGGSTRNVDVTPDRFVTGENRAVVFDPSITFVGGRINSSGGFPSTSSGTHAGVNFRTPAPEAGYRFVRLNITAVNGGSTIRIDEVEYRATVGGADETGAGASFESSLLSGSFPSANLYTGTTSFWLTDSGDTAAWAAYDFGTADPQTVAQYAIKATSTTTDAPQDWTLEGSNDLETWDTLHTVTGETAWSSGETRTFTV